MAGMHAIRRAILTPGVQQTFGLRAMPVTDRLDRMSREWSPSERGTPVKAVGELG